MNVAVLPAASYAPLAAAPSEERIHLNAGALYATDRPALVSTMLSSSVAVCLFSPAVGGVAHFILPIGGSDRSLRYGNHALPVLLEHLIACGVDRSELLASIFGGCEHSATDGGLGRRNVAMARAFLEKNEIPVVREAVGGGAARRLTFRTSDGLALVRALGAAAPSRDRWMSHDIS